MLLNEEEDIDVIGEAEDGEEAIKVAVELSPDVIVMDITMPNVDGIEATRRIVSKLPHVKVIPLSIHSGKRFVENMLRAGAAGYLLKESAPEELVNAIRSVHQGDICLSSAISGVVVSEYVRLLSQPNSGDDRGELSEDEGLLLRLIAEGHSVKEIAATLGSSARSVQSRRKLLISKVGVSNVAELTEYARANQWAEGKAQVNVGASQNANGAVPTASILGTKFHQPNVSRDFVSRRRLLDKLDQSCELPLTLISAPAGYGKSSLMADWLASHHERCAAWLSLSESDSDLRTFVRYLVAAVEGQFPNACHETNTILQASQLPPCCEMADTLNNDLDVIEEPLVLVLDDYHLVSDPDVHELLENLLLHPPRPLHLVLITRHDPPLSLAALRANGWLTEIRQEDLRFSRLEVQSVLEKMTGATLSDMALTHLESELEGWIVGVYLVGLLLRNQPDPEEFIAGLKRGSQQIQDYLSEEVISSQPSTVRDRLLKVSMVERFCAPLVEALCDLDDGTDAQSKGKDFIEEIRRANLFVIPLDLHGEWFRFHHLFQYLLQGQFERSTSRADIAALHLRASKWFEAEELIDDAIEHSLVIGDTKRAAEIVERHARTMMNEDNWYVVEKWLARLPDAQVMKRPELLLARAWRHYYRLNFAAIPPILKRVDALMENSLESRKLSAEVAFFRAFFEFFQGEGEKSLKHIHYALEHTPLTDHEVRAESETFLGLAGQMQGERARVTETITEWLADPSSLNLSPIRETHLLATLSFMSFIASDPMGSAGYLMRMRVVGTANELEYPLAWCDYLEGIFHLRRGEVDLAIGLLEEATKRKYSQHARAAVDALVALAIAYQRQGQTKKSDATCQALNEFVSNLGPLFQPLADACAIRLAIMRGQSNVLQRWLSLSSPPIEVMLFWFEIPCITYCRALVAEGSSASLHTAQERLSEYAAANKAQHNACQLIEVLCLQAVADEKLGNAKRAIQYLQQAVTLAQPGGFVFPFVELGAPIADLLRGLQTKEVAVEFIDRLQAAFSDSETEVEPKVSGIERTSPADQSPSRSLPKPTHQIDGVAIDALTLRELETLELLAQRLYDKEIAKAMSISVWTVKSHVKHIYEKLHVNNRRQAILQAEELGLLQGK